MDEDYFHDNGGGFDDAHRGDHSDGGRGKRARHQGGPSESKPRDGGSNSNGCGTGAASSRDELPVISMRMQGGVQVRQMGCRTL
eukprot:2512459-Amphidinium_carterae.1